MFTPRMRKLLLCSAAAVVLLPSLASAGDRWDRKDRDDDRRRDHRNDDKGRDHRRDDGGRHDRRVDVRVDINLGPDRSECRETVQRVWVEPVYRTVRDRVWVEPVYREVCDRVWREPVYEDRCERIWVPDEYEYREVVRLDRRGQGFIVRERVLVRPGFWEERPRRVCVREGFWEDVRRQELVCDGHWKTIERRELVCEGYWTTRNVREERNRWHGDGYARGRDRGDRYD